MLLFVFRYYGLSGVLSSWGAFARCRPQVRCARPPARNCGESYIAQTLPLHSADFAANINVRGDAAVNISYNRDNIPVLQG